MARNDEDVRQLILERIDSGDWWILVDVGQSELPRVIHQRHYADDADIDFQLVLGPELAYQPLAFFLMRKDNMTAAELAACVSEAGGESLPASVYGQRPFLFAPRRDGPAVVVQSFYDWLEQGRKSRKRAAERS